MKKLLLCLILSAHYAQFSYCFKTEKELLYAFFLNSDFGSLGEVNAKEIAQEFKMYSYRSTLFSGIDRLYHGLNEPIIRFDSNQERYDTYVLIHLHQLADKHNNSHFVLPFIKKGYAVFRSRYKKDPDFAKFGDSFMKIPSKKVLDSYPESFKKGTDAAIILGPLLNPGKLTQAQYQKNIKTFDLSIQSKLSFFIQNRSNILFPGSLQSLTLTEVQRLLDALYIDRLDLKEKPSDEQHLSKPNKKRDLAILKNYWKQSINDPGLVPFIEKGHKNFEKAYHYKAPVRSLLIKKGETLGDYADKNPKSPVAALCNTLEPAPSKFLRNTLILGALSGIAYVIYRKYTAHTNQSDTAPIV